MTTWIEVGMWVLGAAFFIFLVRKINREFDEINELYDQQRRVKFARHLAKLKQKYGDGKSV